MAAYRGKHSRPASHRSSAPKHARRRSGALPTAFKHHDAVHEDGKRPRHSKRKSVLVIIPIIIVIAAVTGGIIFAAGQFLPSSETGTDIVPGVAVTVTIPDGATADEIAKILKQAQVISDTNVFKRDVQYLGAEQSLKPGTYELTTLMDSTMLIDTLVAGPLANASKLTIPEGLTVEQTAEVVEATCGIPQAAFLARAYAADEYASKYPFLKDVYNNSVEGFLYPKTYTIPPNSDADYVVQALLDQFVIETSKLDLSYATQHGMTFFDVITLASVIEKETAISEELTLVSSVIYNRLNRDMKLQIDATVVFVLGKNFSGKVSYEDLEIESPYNTYVIDGLPAGPICSPSAESINAAAHPADTAYIYYVLYSKEGYHTFCENIDEFEAAKEEYNRVFGIE